MLTCSGAWMHVWLKIDVFLFVHLLLFLYLYLCLYLICIYCFVYCMHLWHTVARLLVWPIFDLTCSGRCHPLLTWPPHLCRFRWWWSFGLETGSFDRDDHREVGPQSLPTLFKNLRIYPFFWMSVRHWGSSGTFDRLTTNHALPLSSVGIKIWSLTSDTYIMNCVRL